jgi:hypothetical protein
LCEFEKHRKGSRIFWALVLIVIGVLILLHNLGYLEHDIIRFWPVLVILWGIKKLIE